ncbi:hypothetical protein Q5752_000025 [Cryptotrichosporon argae]
MSMDSPQVGHVPDAEVFHAPYKEGPGMEEAILYPLPPPDDVPPRPLTDTERARIDLLSRLLFFLSTAPTKWSSLPSTHLPDLSKFRLPNGEDVSCVLWNGLYHITGTDIVRALMFRFEAFGRPVKHTKKWEEGVFSDLRNLKPGIDACLEEPKSAFLDFLFRNGCIRTQKKQKVFYWFSVPHDRLFLDALERDLKREKAGQEPTTVVIGEPARSFRYDPRRGLFEQFMGQNRGMEAAILDQVYPLQSRPLQMDELPPAAPYDADMRATPASEPSFWSTRVNSYEPQAPPPQGYDPDYQQQVPSFSVTMFEGSAGYKRRRSSRTPVESGTYPEYPYYQQGHGDGDEPRKRSATRSIRDYSQSRSPDRSASASVPPADQRLYECVYEFCRRPFKRLEHLKRHIRTHTQERPYPCTLCARAFSRQDNLLQHLRLHRREDGKQDGEDRGSAPPYVGRRWPTDSPAPEPRPLPTPSSSHYTFAPPPVLPAQPTRSTTVPPDWLSMPPPAWPPAPAPSAPSSSSSTAPRAHPTFSPADPPRFRSVTPQVSLAMHYGYVPEGTMGPPPLPIGVGLAPPAPTPDPAAAAAAAVAAPPLAPAPDAPAVSPAAYVPAVTGWEDGAPERPDEFAGLAAAAEAWDEA